MTSSSPSSAFRSSAFAAARCASLRWTSVDRKTLASTTTRCTSDASSALAGFVDGFHDVGRAVLDEAFPSPERRAFGADRDAAAVDFPCDFVAGADVERVAYFLRHGRLSLAGDGGGGHRLSPYLMLPMVRLDVRRAGSIVAQGELLAVRIPQRPLREPLRMRLSRLGHAGQ